jgi:hypothetical protein
MQRNGFPPQSRDRVISLVRFSRRPATGSVPPECGWNRVNSDSLGHTWDMRPQPRFRYRLGRGLVIGGPTWVMLGFIFKLEADRPPYPFWISTSLLFFVAGAVVAATGCLLMLISRRAPGPAHPQQDS